MKKNGRPCAPIRSAFEQGGLGFRWQRLRRDVGDSNIVYQNGEYTVFGFDRVDEAAKGHAGISEGITKKSAGLFGSAAL